MCRAGFQLSRPASRAVRSPCRSAAQPCAISCAITEKSSTVAVIGAAFGVALLEIKAIAADRLARDRAAAADRKDAEDRHVAQMDRIERMHTALASGLAAEAGQRALVSAGTPPTAPAVRQLA